MECKTNSDAEEGKRSLNFSYAEEESSDEFFVPAVWATTIRSNPDLDFILPKIELFSPQEKRLV